MRPELAQHLCNPRINSGSIGWTIQEQPSPSDWRIWDAAITTLLGLSQNSLHTNIRPQSLHPPRTKWEWFLTADLGTLIQITMSSGSAKLFPSHSHLHYTLEATTIHFGTLLPLFPIYAADVLLYANHIAVPHFSSSPTLTFEDGP